MALEQRQQQIKTQDKDPDLNGAGLHTSINTPCHLSADPEHMQVSYFYIPHMSSLVEVKRVRKVLLAFADHLLEHHIDLQVRHLTLYHHSAIDELNDALQNLRLGAELQQTLSHYEPIYSQKKNFNPAPINQPEADRRPHPMVGFFYAIWARIQQWLIALVRKKDQ